ncbi:MAG: acetate--CoA ligase family protein [Proteobacteria bacterium]|nr:acetate--CoA ligase family protein [Pseudomonadota bacterium]
MSHFLDPLLRPQSIAIVGATQRKEAVGSKVLKNLLEGEYPGNLYAVNPRYQEIDSVACYPSLSELPQAVEHVIFAVGDERIESALDEAIAHGIKAAIIFSSLVLKNDTTPLLLERIYLKVKQAGILLCGGNGMGFYNFRDSVLACGFATRSHRKQGNVTYISQSGSGMAGILDVDERIDFNFAVSTGQELIVSAEDYLDYALDQPETRVVGFFMETSRHPEKLIAAFNKAKARNIPIVVVKVGRTELAAELALSHSGAMTGSDAVYDAIFDRYGVQRVDDMDQLATALIMFAQPHPVQAGGIVTIHDSGGERQLIIDLADKLDAPLTKISDETTTALEALLEPGLPAVNPLDAWSIGGPDSDQIITDCFVTLLNDSDAALGAIVHDRGPHGHIFPEYIEYLHNGHDASGKPVFLVASRQGTGTDIKVIETTRDGFPVLDGVSAFLSGAKCMMAYRDFLDRPSIKAPILSQAVVTKWRSLLINKFALSENEASRFLSECGVPMTESRVVDNEKELLALVYELTYPVVMKTAVTGIEHKADVDGVRLNIQDESTLISAYYDLSHRLGDKVLIAPMINTPGIEMILGVARDEQFGPMIVMGIGGIYTELLHDIVLVVPPFDVTTACRCLDRLKMRKLLDGIRGKPGVDITAYCKAAVNLSVLAVEFKEQIKEVDINPIKVLEQGCMGLDALIVMNLENTEISNNRKVRRGI